MVGKAIKELQQVIDYLIEYWSEKEVRNFSQKLNSRLELILHYPRIFHKTQKRKHVRRSVISKHTVVYYEVMRKSIYILTLFDTRQNPKKNPY